MTKLRVLVLCFSYFMDNSNVTINKRKMGGFSMVVVGAWVMDGSSNLPR
jgi:hypothetical protein